MIKTADGAHQAQLSETVTAIAVQLAERREVQQNILSVLEGLLETSQAQSEMLADILKAASEDTGPSPIAEALRVLAAHVQEMDEHQMTLIASMAELPEAIGRQFKTSLNEQSAARTVKR